MFGCNKPMGWVYPEDATSLYVPPVKNDTSDFWNEQWWLDQNGEQNIPFNVENNVINFYGGRALQVNLYRAFGSYPNYTIKPFAYYECFLEAPAQWYERTVMAINNNTYTGEWKAPMYYASPIEHSIDQCGEPVPAGPGPGDGSTFFRIGANETIN